MSSRNRSTPGGSSRRVTAVPVNKPRPWGLIAGSVVLAVALIGLVAYAAANQGSGARNVLADLDNSFDGLDVAAEEELARDHVATQVDYPRTVPVGGQHNGAWQNCGVYDQPIAPEHAVHSLEHGAVWVTYRPDLPEDQVQELRELAEDERYALMSPVPEQESPILLTAWGRQLELERPGDEVEKFLDGYAEGPQTPERGAACSGGVSTTGPLQAPPPAPAPAPTAQASTAPSPEASAPAAVPSPAAS